MQLVKTWDIDELPEDIQNMIHDFTGHQWIEVEKHNLLTEDEQMFHNFFLNNGAFPGEIILIVSSDF